MRTAYVPDGTPVRLCETVKDVKVWVKDADGQPVPGRMSLPEGWYCLPDQGSTATEMSGLGSGLVASEE